MEINYLKLCAVNFLHLRITAHPETQNNIHTIEFRVPNGTVNPNTWIENINLYGGLMRTSKELAIIQSKSANDLTQEDMRKLQILEQLKSKGISESEQLNFLLELLLSEEQRQTYVDRYEANMPLIDNSQDLQSVMSEKIATEPVDYSLWRPTSRSVGKYCYTINNPENEPVDGVGVQETEERFRRSLQLVFFLQQNADDLMNIIRN